MSPKITAPTLAEQRSITQQKLIEAALQIALSAGSDSITVTEVARRAGFSRSVFYQYFSSADDLITDLLINELNAMNSHLISSVSTLSDPIEYLSIWISESLKYVADGRHLLAKSLNAIQIPEFRKLEFDQAHMQLIHAIAKPIKELGISDVSGALAYIRKALEAATSRIESGGHPDLEISSAVIFITGGISALALSSRRV
jgi:AcrR family transcriptional regulator